MISSLYSYGEDYRFIKGNRTFVINETKREYVVTYYLNNSGNTSRNKNITDRQNRLEAIDLIGSYILYRQSSVSSTLPADYFQVYVEGLNLHYDAILEGLSQAVQDNKIIYTCKKENYNIESSSYNTNVDIYSLLQRKYSLDKNESSAELLYRYPSFSSELLVSMEKDVLTGNAHFPNCIHQLQSVQDRFESSIYGENGNVTAIRQKLDKEIENLTSPYSFFALEEMVTSLPLEEKSRYYSLWKKNLNDDRCIYEAVLHFCAEKCAGECPDLRSSCFTSVIEAFPGAINPFGVRRPIDNILYDKAAKAYSEENFSGAADILKESIDNEGLSEATLNLAGASYRYLGCPRKAMPYLLLGFKMNPRTPYLAGNLYLCLKELGFKNEKQLREFLSYYICEDWSRDILVQ